MKFPQNFLARAGVLTAGAGVLTAGSGGEMTGVCTALVYLSLLAVNNIGFLQHLLFGLVPV